MLKNVNLLCFPVCAGCLGNIDVLLCVIDLPSKYFKVIFYIRSCSVQTLKRLAEKAIRLKLMNRGWQISTKYAPAKLGDGAQLSSLKSFEGRRWYDGLKVPKRQEYNVIRCGPLEIDNDRKTVRVGGDVRTIAPKLFGLLKVFMSNPGKILSHGELAVSLWPDNNRADPDDVKQHIYLLRKVIETDPGHPCRIKNLRGFGYQLVITSQVNQ